MHFRSFTITVVTIFATAQSVFTTTIVLIPARSLLLLLHDCLALEPFASPQDAPLSLAASADK
jgi:hypothetical protein